MARVITDTKSPLVCTDAEIAAFCCLVRQGGEVESAGLEARARAARALVFLYVEANLVGVAALKQPSAAYRDASFDVAGAGKMRSRYNLELGWVFVPPEHRGRHYSRVVACAAMSQAENAPTFATTRADNAAMQKTLEHLGFARVGKPWKSKRGDYELVLYVAPAPSDEKPAPKSPQTGKPRR